MSRDIVGYYAHTMDGIPTLEESGESAYQFERKLGQGYKMLIPERFQVGYSKQKVQDIKNILQADFVIADIRRVGDIVDNRAICGNGTNQEIGIATGLNYTRKDKIPVIIITRKNRKLSCFNIQGCSERFGLCKITYSIDEAIKYVKSGQWRRWK
jgi:hypothetical protein